MVRKGLISRREELWGNKKITIYKVTSNGLDFCRRILEPYEEMFPRKSKER